MNWRAHQRTTFLVASGLSTAGSFAGLTAKGWILIDGNNNPMLLALHFAVLIRSQWGLFGAGLLGAIAIPLTDGGLQVSLLLLSTLLVGIASAYELSARNKYCALLVESPEQLAPYLTSFSVVFNVGKLVGPPLGGWLLAWTGAGTALAIDAATFLLPIASVIWLLSPDRSREQRSAPGASASLRAAWTTSGPVLRHVLRFTAVACLVGFFHPGLAPLMARDLLGPSPQALGLFTSVLAAGSISGGLVLQRHSRWLSQRPALLLGSCTLITATAQLALARFSQPATSGLGLAATFAIGAGTACLLSAVNLISQVGSPMAIRGRMAGLGQIAFLGGGGLSGLMAAALTLMIGLHATLALLGGTGLLLGLLELQRRHGLRLELRSA